MSPTLFRYRNFRFLFFSKEETRSHVHVLSPKGEAKFWIEPRIELAHSSGLIEKDIKTLQKIVEKKRDEIQKEWKRYFGR